MCRTQIHPDAGSDEQHGWCRNARAVASMHVQAQGVTRQMHTSLLNGTRLCGPARGAVRGGARRADTGVVEQRVGRNAALADASIRAPGAQRGAAGFTARGKTLPC